MTLGRLETLGYTQAEARAHLDAFVSHPYSYIVDIRSKPYSWNPNWNREALKARYGRRYVHLPGLGNRNYGQKGMPIELADPDQHVRHLAEQLERGRSYLLLCACKAYERCHRRLVYDLVRAALDPTREPVAVQAGYQLAEHTPTYVTLSLWEG